MWGGVSCCYLDQWVWDASFGTSVLRRNITNILFSSAMLFPTPLHSLTITNCILHCVVLHSRLFHFFILLRFWTNQRLKNYWIKLKECDLIWLMYFISRCWIDHWQYVLALQARDVFKAKEAVLQKKISQEMERAKEFTKSGNKQAAMQCLKRKKYYESQMNQVGSVQLRINSKERMIADHTGNK